MRQRLLAASVGAIVLTGIVSVPAGAATGSVSIGKIRTQTAPYKKAVTVKPRVSTHGQATISSKKLTVKKGKKTVARNRSSARLKAGTYSVTQTVKYRTFGYATKNVVAIAAGDQIYFDGDPVNLDGCTVTVSNEDAFSATCNIFGATTPTVVVTDRAAIDVPTESLVPGDSIYPGSIVTPRTIYRSTKVRKYGKTRTTTRKQSLKIKAGKKPRTCATKADFDRVRWDFDDPENYGDTKARVKTLLHSSGKQTQYSDYGDYVIEFRDYKTCDKDASLSVGFFAGYAYAKSYYSF